ncbi:dihydrodipicolinate reductase [Marivita sp. S2033]|uniref:dihydrodipicolinate reductase n=1 Tax=Marivita sp. S2033 TaxID=3373187 RepID=UPI0039820C7A
MPHRAVIAAIALVSTLTPQSAAAEMKRIDSKSEFVQLVQGKTLSRAFVKLRVGADGAIAGRGAGWDVTGRWDWKDGYFCRDLNWGGDDLGYNCQEVRADGRAMRFTADKGTGDAANFTLR